MANLNITARMATLDQLVNTLIPAYLTPTPAHETLREWSDTARIPRFKAADPFLIIEIGASRRLLIFQNAVKRSRKHPGGANGDEFLKRDFNKARLTVNNQNT
jgi:hypothetical protein